MDKDIKKALKRKYKKSAAARTNIHNKRIGAIKAVRRSKELTDTKRLEKIADTAEFFAEMGKMPIRSGVHAQSVDVGDKIVKSNKSPDKAMATDKWKSIPERARIKMRLAKGRLTPDPILVMTSKDNYAVMDKLDDLSEFSDTVKTEENLSSKIIKRGYVPNDMHDGNIMKTKKGSKRVIDVGHFGKIKNKDRKGLERKFMKQTVSAPSKATSRTVKDGKFVTKYGDEFLKALSKGVKKGVKRLPVIAGAVGLGSALMEEGQAREKGLDEALDPVPFGADRVEAPTLTKNQVTEYMKRKYATDPDYRKQRKLRGK